MKRNAGQVLPLFVFFVCIALGVGSVITALRLSEQTLPEIFVSQGEPCSPEGSYSRRCTGNCGGCNEDAGEAEVWRCENGTWSSSWGECRTECAGPCSNSDDNSSDNDSSNCDSNSDCSDDQVCHYGSCTPCTSIGDESTCWTHGERCTWLNGSCQVNQGPGDAVLEGDAYHFCNTGGSSVDLSVAECKEEYWPDKTKDQCEADANKGVGCQSRTVTLDPGECMDLSSPATCGIYQLDVSGAGWQRAATGCSWNNSLCSTPTYPNFSCNSLKVSSTTTQVGSSVSIEANVSDYGVIRYAKVPEANMEKGRVILGTGIATLETTGSNTIRGTFTPTEPGIYAFETNAYESNQCKYLCAVGGILYENTVGLNRCVIDAADWQNLGISCSNNCIKWITVEEVQEPLSCTELSPSNSNPSRGQTVTYTCKGSGSNASSANFRVLLNNEIIPDTGITGVALNENKEAMWDYFIPEDAASGTYTVECQICHTNNTCTSWGHIQDEY